MLSDKDGLRAPDLVWKGTGGKPERTALCGVYVGPNVHGQIASQKSPLKIMNVKKKKNPGMLQGLWEPKLNYPCEVASVTQGTQEEFYAKDTPTCYAPCKLVCSHFPKVPKKITKHTKTFISLEMINRCNK